MEKDVKPAIGMEKDVKPSGWRRCQVGARTVSATSQPSPPSARATSASDPFCCEGGCEGGRCSSKMRETRVARGLPKYGRPVPIHSILRVGWGVLVDEAEALDDSVDERRAIGRLGTDEDVTQAVERRRWLETRLEQGAVGVWLRMRAR